MAADHHHSGFDQDQFERYDTFDAPVSEDVGGGRAGFAGDIGRLIDQIKIANAANKLDQDVSIGEDRVLNDSGNWAAVPHQELYNSVHANNDPTAAYALAREWTDLGNVMADNSRAMDEAIRGTESGWQGTAAQSARESTLKLATWGGDAAQTSQYMGTRIAEQGLAAERAKAAMPEPVQFDWQQMLRQGFATGGLAGFAKAVQDVQVVSEQARTAHEQAVQVMSEMETQSKNVDQTTPRFVRPPDATATASSAADGLMMTRSEGDLVTPATPVTPMGSAFTGGGGVPQGQGQFATTSGGPPTGGFPGGGVPGGGSPGGGVPGGGGYQPAAASYVPPNIQVPDIPTGGGTFTGTSTSGFAPPPVPGGFPGGTPYPGTNYPTGNPSNFTPPGGYTPDSVYNPGQYNPGKPANQPNNYVPPRIPGTFNPVTGEPYPPKMPNTLNPVTGEPYAPGSGPRPGMPPYGGGSGGGGGGGFGPRGGPGSFGGAGGFGEQNAIRQPGTSAGAGVGAVAAEEAAMRGGGVNPAGAGRPGTAGSPGMGGGGMGGAGGGKREDDMEHRSKYATGEKVVEEPGRMVPLVIGEKSARPRKEEQPPE
jgi:hypothetical protein